MKPQSEDAPKPSAGDQREAFETLTGLPASTDKLMNRLQFISAVLDASKTLPAAPLLLWLDKNKAAQQMVIGSELVVGRDAGKAGLSLAEDQRLSRRHFVVRRAGDEWRLEDLRSRNGTAVNSVENRVRVHALRDGDLIFAGSQVFVFLDPTRTT